MKRDAFTFVLKTILSCKTEEHLQCAEKLTQLFIDQGNPDVSYREIITLKKILNFKKQTL